MILLAEFMVRWKQKVPVVVSDGLDTCWYDIDGAKGRKVYWSNYVTINLTMVTMILFSESSYQNTTEGEDNILNVVIVKLQFIALGASRWISLWKFSMLNILSSTGRSALLLLLIIIPRTHLLLYSLFYVLLHNLTTNNSNTATVTSYNAQTRSYSTPSTFTIVTIRIYGISNRITAIRSNPNSKAQPLLSVREVIWSTSSWATPHCFGQNRNLHWHRITQYIIFDSTHQSKSFHHKRSTID